MRLIKSDEASIKFEPQESVAGVVLPAYFVGTSPTDGGWHGREWRHQKMDKGRRRYERFQHGATAIDWRQNSRLANVVSRDFSRAQNGFAQRLQECNHYTQHYYSTAVAVIIGKRTLLAKPETGRISVQGDQRDIIMESPFTPVTRSFRVYIGMIKHMVM